MCNKGSSRAFLLTLFISFSSSGPRSWAALLRDSSAFFLYEAARRSTSLSTLAQDSSMFPEAIFDIVSGDTLSSSTKGLSAFSTCLRLSSRLLSAVDRSCNDSISAETVARSFRKLVKLVSTELNISSHAVMERCKSSNLA